MVRAEPDLQALSGDGPNIGHHLPPFGAVGDQFLCDDLHHAEGHGKDDPVEIDSAAKRSRLGIVANPEVGLEILDTIPWHDLFAPRPVGENGKPVHPGQRVVLVDTFGQPDLAPDRDRLDVVSVSSR